MTGDRSEVFSKLRKFEEHITQILDQIGDKRSITDQEKEQLQRSYRTLKSDLSREVKRSETIVGSESLSEFESAYLIPAVSQAIGELVAATNSHPINSDWYSQLYAARIDLQFFLRQLANQ